MTEAKPTLTLNDLALALVGVQHAQQWWRNIALPCGYRTRELRKLDALNKKLAAILDGFGLPENDEGERPDNGDQLVTLELWPPSPSSPVIVRGAEAATSELFRRYDKGERVSFGDMRDLIAKHMADALSALDNQAGTS